MKINIIISICSVLFCFLSCGKDYITGEGFDTNPNTQDEITLEKLVTAIQLNAYVVMQDPANMAHTIMQQLIFTGCGLSAVSHGYEFLVQAPYRWHNFYTASGLTDIRKTIAIAEDQGKHHLAGIIKLWEVLIFTTAAEYWGDIPYSEAADQSNPYPKPDKQSDIYAQLHAKLDEAIEDLQSETAAYDSNNDFTYKGNTEQWIAAAHTLKARMYLNWAEIDPANYGRALAETSLGIGAIPDNWRCYHENEENMMNLRQGFYYLSTTRSARGIIELMERNSDPRLKTYFMYDEDNLYQHGWRNWEFRLNPETYEHPGWDTELVTWEENMFIRAECLYAAGDELSAVNTLDLILEKIEEKWELPQNSIQRYSERGLTGPELLRAIIEEKYLALFLNPQVWSDYRRTAFPIISTQWYSMGNPMPRRFPYPNSEIEMNPHITAKGQNTRNENDPYDPVYPGITINQ